MLEYNPKQTHCLILCKVGIRSGLIVEHKTRRCRESRSAPRGAASGGNTRPDFTLLPNAQSVANDHLRALASPGGMRARSDARVHRSESVLDE